MHHERDRPKKAERSDEFIGAFRKREKTWSRSRPKPNKQYFPHRTIWISPPILLANLMRVQHES